MKAKVKYAMMPLYESVAVKYKLIAKVNSKTKKERIKI